MRDVYYQSVGNPLQNDRLPVTRPVTQFLSRANALDTGMFIVQVPGICLILGAVTMLMYQAPGFSLFDPYDLLLAVPVILIGLSLSVWKNTLDHVLHPAVLLAVGVTCLNHRVPWAVQILFIAMLAGALVFQFGRHGVAVLTTPPLSRELAESTRAATHDTLMILAGITALMVAVMLWFGGRFLTVAVVTLPLAAFCCPPPARMKLPRWRFWLYCLRTWYGYAPMHRPGLLQSPAGSVFHRAALTLLAAELMGIVLVCWDGSPLGGVFEIGAQHHATVTERMDAIHAGPFERMKHGSVTWLATFAAMAALPVVIPMFMAVAIATPALCQAAAAATKSEETNDTESIIADIQSSPDPIERDSIYLGRVVADGSPMLVPRSVFSEHAHGLGDSGSGKTALFLCPLIEQLAMSGDCSVIVVDLKADSLELLATLMASAEKVQERRGITIPVKCFSNQANKATFAFNPMTQSFWENFDLLTRTDILCGANGLTYGTDYGSGYYSSANAAVLYHAMKSFPHVRTFEELAECIGTVITTAKKQDLHPEVRKAGVHVQEVMKRLAHCAPLNVTASTGHDPEVVAQAIDLSQPFLTPQLLYFHLSSTLSPSGAPEIGRLVNYILLAASTQTERKHPVYLVIDEFQRMVASNLEYMLQLARSMGVGVILANQSMEDLNKGTANLITPIEANCRLRQWFSVSSARDRERLIESSGETVDISWSRSHKENPTGDVLYSYSEKETVVPRITINDVLLMSDHPFRSVVRMSRGDGYAQYGGFPVIIQSHYHISKREYERRRAMPWPSLPGMLQPGSRRQDATPAVKTPAGPTFTQDVIGSEGEGSTGISQETIDEFISGLKKSFVPEQSVPKPRRKKRTET